MAPRSSGRQPSGSPPPCGAIPTSSAVGPSASPSSRVATTGMAPPKPSTSCTVLPRLRTSSTQAMRSGMKRTALFAVLLVSGPNCPSATTR